MQSDSVLACILYQIFPYSNVTQLEMLKMICVLCVCVVVSRTADRTVAVFVVCNLKLL